MSRRVVFEYLVKRSNFNTSSVRLEIVENHALNNQSRLRRPCGDTCARFLGGRRGKSHVWNKSARFNKKKEFVLVGE